MYTVTSMWSSRGEHGGGPVTVKVEEFPTYVQAARRATHLDASWKRHLLGVRVDHVRESRAEVAR